MRIRPMTQNDIPSVASIAADAFTGDELFLHTYPRHKSLPPSYRRQKLIRFKQRLVTRGTHCFVAESPSGGELVGYACWEHRGVEAKNEDLRYGNGWIDKLERLLLATEMWYEKLMDQDSDYGIIREYSQSTKYDYYSSIKEYWTLSSIAALKIYQRNGVGRRLMEWGMSAACKSDLPLVLDTSRSGRRLYEKLGFRIVELEEVSGLRLEGVVMVWRRSVSGSEVEACKEMNEMEDAN